jgi:hypothetical protein
LGRGKCHTVVGGYFSFSDKSYRKHFNRLRACNIRFKKKDNT